MKSFQTIGTNFVGAQAELLQDPLYLLRIKLKTLSSTGLQLKEFNGTSLQVGLCILYTFWEAALQSIKTLLNKVVGELVLRWEEFLTVLVSAAKLHLIADPLLQWNHLR